MWEIFNLKHEKMLLLNMNNWRQVVRWKSEAKRWRRK